MSFDLHGILAPDAAADKIKQQFSAAVVVRLAQGISLIPMSVKFAAQVGAGPNVEYPDFEELGPPLVAALVEASRDARVAYVEAEDFGDVGGQAALVWEGGVLLVEPIVLRPGEAWPAAGGPVDQALRLLGVSAADGAEDEFVAVGLGRFRHTEQWAT